jgi:fumarate reductase flavoprotein subunit
MELGPRDRLSQAFVHEQEKGRTLETEYGPVVHLDLRHLGARLIDEKLPFVRELCLRYQNIDPVRELVPVRPVVHYMMGGVHTDLWGATPVAGLYAAGETACVSINGANRLGSNSLPECLVFGARAGKAAAEYAASAADPGTSIGAQARDEERRLTDLRDRDRSARGDGSSGEGVGSVSQLRTAMQEVMESSAGIFRTEESLATGAAGLRTLHERATRVALDDHSSAFNTEIVSALELENMLDLAEAIVASALQRKESRGAHQRLDFAGRDDDRFLAHTLIHHDPAGEHRTELLPVTITSWPPGERVYGRKGHG